MSKQNGPSSIIRPDTKTPGDAPNSPLGLSLMFMGVLFALIVLAISNRYWLAPPHEKMTSTLRGDIEILKNSPRRKVIDRVSKISFSAPGHTPATDWLSLLNSAIPKSPQGDLELEVTLIHMISDGPGSLTKPQRYGVITQFEFFELKTKNKVAEFARTYWLGIYF